MTDANVEKALALAGLGFAVFPVRHGSDNTKTPLTEHGHLDSSSDPDQIKEWYLENPRSEVEVDVGSSGLVVLDVDMKDGKDGWASLEEAWLEIPETFGYDTSTGGRHLVYAAPEGVRLAPSSKFLGMEGVDVRGGSSWALWAGPVPSDRTVFSPAPEWLCAEQEVRSAESFEGDLKDWFDNLVPGEPNVLIRRALDRIHDDLSHSEMVERQFEAIRLGAEGNPGVPQLLSRLESAWLARPSENHSTPEDKWEYKFAEALATGIAKYGDSIQLLKDLPEYSWDLVPVGIPDTLVRGESGGKPEFSRLLDALISVSLDPLLITSVLWNSPVTKEQAREWGLEFVHRRVQDALRERNPLLTPGTDPVQVPWIDERSTVLLSPEEMGFVGTQRTFIDDYCEASETKGFVNKNYAIPFAWTCLSMAVGYRAYIPVGGSLGVNLWFNVLGYSGTGKSKELQFASSILDMVFRGQETYWNLGASSSPEGLQETLLLRDGLSSIILEDEASSFYANLRSKDWMSSITHNFSDWYMGDVRPSNKVRLKELKGKSAKTSFNLHMVTTPDKALRLLDTEMFETGFLARSNWVLTDPPRQKTSDRYRSSLTETIDGGMLPAAYDIALDLMAICSWPKEDRLAVLASAEARDRLDQAHEDMDRFAEKQPLYSITEPSVTRLAETSWKCAALLALWRGSDVIELKDALIALSHVQVWFSTLFEVAGQVAQGDFQRDCMEILDFLLSRSEPVKRSMLIKKFGHLIKKNRAELHDKIEFLLESGTIKSVNLNGSEIAYEPAVRKGAQ